MSRRLFRDIMAERRAAKRKGWAVEIEYLTRAARKAVWNMRNVPVNMWKELEND